MTSRSNAVAAPVLAGEPARRWIAQQGWDAPSGEHFQLSADRLEDRTFSLSRIWHSAALLHRSGTAESDSVIILIGIEGFGAVSAHGRESELGVRQMIIANAATPLQLTSAGASARLEVVMKRHRLGPTQLLLGRDVEVFTLEERYWRTLASLIVTVLSTGVSPHDSGFTPLKAAIENTVAAAIAQSPLDAHPTRGSHAPLLARAQRIIEARFEDQQFSTSELARELAVSSAHLYRVFGLSSMTPYQMIQQRRAKCAVDLMHGSHFPDSAVAMQSGFSSPRAMRRALRKHAGAEGKVSCSVSDTVRTHDDQNQDSE